MGEIVVVGIFVLIMLGSFIGPLSWAKGLLVLTAGMIAAIVFALMTGLNPEMNGWYGLFVINGLGLIMFISHVARTRREISLPPKCCGGR